MKKFEVVTLPMIETETSIMSPIELKNFIDFEVKRVYYISKPKQNTGQHCHYIEKEFFIMIQGTCTAVIDKRNGKEDIPLIGPKSGIYVPNYVWHGFKDLSPDAIILALSSTNYKPDRSDYLDDYDDYLKIRDEKLNE